MYYVHNAKFYGLNTLEDELRINFSLSTRERERERERQRRKIKASVLFMFSHLQTSKEVLLKEKDSFPQF